MKIKYTLYTFKTYDGDEIEIKLGSDIKAQYVVLEGDGTVVRSFATPWAAKDFINATYEVVGRSRCYSGLHRYAYGGNWR